MHDLLTPRNDFMKKKIIISMIINTLPLTFSAKVQSKKLTIHADYWHLIANVDKTLSKELEALLLNSSITIGRYFPEIYLIKGICACPINEKMHILILLTVAGIKSFLSASTLVEHLKFNMLKEQGAQPIAQAILKHLETNA